MYPCLLYTSFLGNVVPFVSQMPKVTNTAGKEIAPDVNGPTSLYFFKKSVEMCIRARYNDSSSIFISTPNELLSSRTISCKGRWLKMNDPLRQAISSAAFWGVSRVRLPFSLLYMALSLGRNIIRSGLLAMVTATEPSNRVVFTSGSLG